MSSVLAYPPASRAPLRTPPRRAALHTGLRGLAHRAEHGFVVVAIFLYSQGVVPLVLRSAGSEVSTTEGNSTLRVIFLLVNSVAIGLALWQGRAAGKVVLRDRFLLALVLFAIASYAWSGAPDVTLRRSFQLVGTTAFGVYLAVRFELRALIRLVGIALALGALLSAIFALGLPALGVEQGIHAGAWRGIYTQKNTLGQVMAIAGVLFVVLARSVHRRRWLPWACAALAVALLLLSTSKTALVILVGLLVLMQLYGALRWQISVAIAFVITTTVLAVSAGTWFMANRETVLVALGRDPTLTGRTDLWDAALRIGSERPLLGFGFNAFWTGASGPSGRLWDAVGWEAPHAHNGFLDLWLDLGWVGVVLFTVGLLAATGRAVKLLRLMPGAEAFWPLLYLTFMLLYNLTESTVLEPNNLVWVLYVAAVAAANRGALAGAAVAVPAGQAASAAPTTWRAAAPGWHRAPAGFSSARGG